MSAIRAATVADASRLAALHGRCFSEGWDAASFERLLRHDGSVVLIAHSPSGLPLAFVVARVAASECEILTLGTAPEARRGGLAGALVRQAAEGAAARGAEDMFLEVSEQNAAARALYAGLGFAVVGRRPGYYVTEGTAVDALTLRATLPLVPK